MGRIYIDRYTGSLERTDLYLVRLTLKDGTVYEDLEPRMLFPFTNHTMFITLLNREEKELGFVRDLEELDRDSRQALEECFREYYMVPKILRLLECEDKFGSLKWKVETDHGIVTFRIRNRHSDIKHLYGTKRVIIRDSNDNRYEIPDYTAMDAHSNRLLFSYL
ncbi:MAG: DUF1854 domain-containing protein [Clostridia bacterium]|nr:DUF1854 domain-containing protein [Clostridia bacterium]